jgi:hypothetical protein
MTSRLITTSYGRAALDALRAVVAEVKRDDPMAPVTLLLTMGDGSPLPHGFRQPSHGELPAHLPGQPVLRRCEPRLGKRTG